MGPCRETQLHPDGGTEEGVSQANFTCFLVFPRIRPAFWSLLRTQVPVSALSETFQMCPWQNLSSFPSPSFGQMVEWFSYGTSVSDSETEARNGECPGQEESPSTPWNRHPIPTSAHHCGPLALLSRDALRFSYPQCGASTKPPHLFP